MWQVLCRNATLLGALMLLVLPVAANISPVPKWNAGQVVRDAELVVVVTGPLLEDVLPRVEAPEVFGREGPAWIHRFLVTGVLTGEVDEESEIVIIHPPGQIIHRYANIAFGDSLLFLKRMSAEDVNVIRENMPWGGDGLPEEIWTFVEPEFQWMSWIQLKTIRPDDEIDEEPRSILAAQLTQYAGIERERQAIITYIQELVALRQAVLAQDGELPDEENLDRFQKAIMQVALTELQESQE